MGKLETDNNNTFDEIWDECKDSIRKLCEIKLHSAPDVAEDVFSEVFLAYMKAIDSGTIITYPKAWLFKVANNKINQKYKEININKEILISIEEMKSDSIQLAVETDILDSMISDADIEKMADEIINGLPDRERILLIYFHQEHKSFREIAVLLGKTEDAVKQQHYRLSKKVKALASENLYNYRKNF